MANTFVIACPNCAKQVRVSDEHVGKRIKCKGCATIFPVANPDGTPAAEKAKAAAPPVPRTNESPPPVDEEYDPNKYILTETNDSLPRCPFCANQMESAEALICLHCGYNTRTRTRPEVKRIYQPTGLEVFLWLLPGILCVLTAIGMLVWYLIFWNKIEDWMADSWFEDEPGPPRTFLAGLGPGAMRLYHALLIAALYVPMYRFSYKRLVMNNKPPERKIKEDLY
jgi:hypothetical protein